MLWVPPVPSGFRFEIHNVAVVLNVKPNAFVWKIEPKHLVKVPGRIPVDSNSNSDSQ